MFRKIYKVILSLFRRQKRTEKKKEEIALAATAESLPGSEESLCEDDSAEADVWNKEISLLPRRITLLTSGLKPYRRRMPGVKCMKVDGFTDAYHFMLMLCGKLDFLLKRRGRHFLYVVILPRNAGTLQLTDKIRGADKRVAAILRLNIPAYNCEVKEIRFIVTNSKFSLQDLE